MYKTSAALFTCLLATSLIATPRARASDEVSCGSVSNGWSAPNGSYVFSRGKTGPIRAVINGVGEYRSHSMLPHGPGGWVSHETMKTPDQQGVFDDICNAPLVPGQLEGGYPGASQVKQGGIYTFLYGDPEAGTEYLSYNRGTGSPYVSQSGVTAANWLWSSMPYSTAWSTADGGQFFYRLRSVANGGYVNYGVFQYRDLGGVNSGDDGGNRMICSTLGPYAVAKTHNGYTTTPWTYSHAQVSNAATVLYGAVESECESGYGFFETIGSIFRCFDLSLCDEAAAQVTNCMSSNRCDTSDDSIWQGVRDDPNATARTWSPDSAAGYRPGQAWSGADQGPWAYDSAQTLVWNSGGNGYACWF